MTDKVQKIKEEPASEDLENIIDIIMDKKIMYASREEGIESFAKTYSFNIESVLFNQLTLEQQKLWRKEIENAAINGGEMGLELANDKRYDKELSKDLDEEIGKYTTNYLLKKRNYSTGVYHLTQKDCDDIARHFAEWQKQQMMKDAVNATILDVDAQTIEFGLWPEKLLNIKEGDKVKIVIIKSKQQ